MPLFSPVDAHLGTIIVDVFDPDSEPHLRLSPVRGAPVTGPDLQLVFPLVSLEVNQSPGLEEACQVINVERNVLRVHVGHAVADVGVLAAVPVSGTDSQHPASRRLVLIKVNGFLALLECRIVVIDVLDNNPDTGGALAPAAHVGLVHGAHGERVAGLELCVEGPGHVEQPQHRVNAELLVLVAAHNLEQHFGVPPRVLVTDLKTEYKNFNSRLRDQMLYEARAVCPIKDRQCGRLAIN